MSMQISNHFKDYQREYLNGMSAGQEKANETGSGKAAERKSEGIPVPKDEYTHGEKPADKADGLYRLGQDDNGNPKITYDDPKKAEKHTVNTDQVDREIEKLKEEKKQLEQQLRAAAGDEERTKELERKLAQIESQLSQKDNDTYRRQRAVVS